MSHYCCAAEPRPSTILRAGLPAVVLNEDLQSLRRGHWLRAALQGQWLSVVPCRKNLVRSQRSACSESLYILCDSNTASSPAPIPPASRCCSSRSIDHPPLCCCLLPTPSVDFRTSIFVDVCSQMLHAVQAKTPCGVGGQRSRGDLQPLPSTGPGRNNSSQIGPISVGEIASASFGNGKNTLHRQCLPKCCNSSGMQLGMQPVQARFCDTLSRVAPPSIRQGNSQRMPTTTRSNSQNQGQPACQMAGSTSLPSGWPFRLHVPRCCHKTTYTSS